MNPFSPSANGPPAAPAANLSTGPPAPAVASNLSATPLTSPPQQQQAGIKMPRMSAAGKRIGRPPKKGTHIATNSMSSKMLMEDEEMPGPEGEETAKRKRKSPHKK